MKFLTAALLTVLITTGMSVSKPANANDLVVSICNFVAADDKGRLRKKLRNAKVKLRNIYDGCNL